MENIKLVKWTFETRFSFHEGLFTIEAKYLDWIKGKHITAWFGEIEGKYSEVDYVFDEEDFKVIDCSDNFAEEFESLLGNIGLNPFLAQGKIKDAFEDIDEYIDLNIKTQLDKLYEENI